MGRRTPLALTLLMVVAIALTGTASASAARKHTRRARAHRCPAATPHHPHRRGRRKCVAQGSRAAKHGTHGHGSKQTNSPSVTTGPLVVGLNANVANWGGPSTADRLGAVTRATATKWLREEIDWATVEPLPGVFDFSRYDHFMQLAAQRRLHVLAVLYDTPSWAGPAYNAIPSDPTAFSQYRRRGRGPLRIGRQLLGAIPHAHPFADHDLGALERGLPRHRRRRRLRPGQLRPAGQGRVHRRTRRRPERKVPDRRRDAERARRRTEIGNGGWMPSTRPSPT